MSIADVRHQPVIGIMTPSIMLMTLLMPVCGSTLQVHAWVCVGLGLSHHSLMNTAQENRAYTFINMTETSTLTMSNQLVFRGTPKISDQYAI